jgi:methylmalonyl-CoA mutase cobalamin-binding domain/chain
MNDQSSRGPSALNPQALERLSSQVQAWETGEVAKFLSRAPERKKDFATLGGFPVKRTYTALDLADTPLEDIGLPGQYPFTRGPYPTMYRGRIWTMRQIAGFGTAEDTNQRFKYLIEQGQTGLSTDFDMPTLMGYDSDHPMSEGEVGREGVAVDTVADMEALFDQIDLEKISVSLTINPSAWILLAMYVALAEQRGHDLDRLSGTIQNDILKEYIAQKEWVYPVRHSLRIVRDTIVYCARHMARYNPINISGYHISEAGASPVQELAFTMANARTYVEEVLATGMAIDDFAPRLAFYFVSQADFLEEIAKFRAARRIWARIVRDEFGARRPDSMRLRFHCQTAAASLTRAQPHNNIVRTTLQALAAVLGGAQSLHTNGLDEAYAIPSEFAMKLALRTQQIIAEESGITKVIDPLGGSYCVEALTADFEREVWRHLHTVERLGGTVAAIEHGYFQREIADFAYGVAQRRASGEQVVVGVNRYVDPPGEEQAVEVHRVDPLVEQRQIEHLRACRNRRSSAEVGDRLRDLRAVAADHDANLMPATIAAVKARATLGEIVGALEDVFGRYTEAPVI